MPMLMLLLLLLLLLCLLLCLLLLLHRCRHRCVLLSGHQAVSRRVDAGAHRHALL